MRRVRHSTRRMLPIPGDVLVEAGSTVEAKQVVARTLLPGPVTPVNVAQVLSIPAGEIPAAILRAAGDPVAQGELLARSRGIFGWFPAECRAPTGGTIESISPVTGQVLLRGAPQTVEVKAYLTGQVTEVIPQQGLTVTAQVTFVQGIFGIGGEAYGPLMMAGESPDEPLTEVRLGPAHRGAIVVGGARVTAEALAAAREQRVAAIVTGGLDDHDLRDFLGYDLGVATTGSEQVGLTLIITEGFGEIGMARRTWELLASRAGAMAAVNGSTQIRAGVVRPEIVIPWSDVAARTNGEILGADDRPPAELAAGATVRIIRDPWFGRIGSVRSLPSEPRLLASGARARVVEVQLESGERAVVPRANVELLEG